MEQNIIKGMLKTLSDVYGLDYKYYADVDVEQGLQEPCFFVKSLITSQTPYPSQRLYRQYSFDVQYFPSASNNNKEMREIGEELFSVFEILELLDGLTIRAVNMRHEIQNGILHFFVDYNVFLDIDKDDVEDMEILEHITTV